MGIGDHTPRACPAGEPCQQRQLSHAMLGEGDGARPQLADLAAQHGWPALACLGIYPCMANFSRSQTLKHPPLSGLNCPPLPLCLCRPCTAPRIPTRFVSCVADLCASPAERGVAASHLQRSATGHYRSLLQCNGGKVHLRLGQGSGACAVAAPISARLCQVLALGHAALVFCPQSNISQATIREFIDADLEAEVRSIVKRTALSHARALLPFAVPTPALLPSRSCPLCPASAPSQCRTCRRQVSRTLSTLWASS